MRLIDADSLKETINANDYVLKDFLNSMDKGMFTLGIMYAINEQPTVDAVPVIRCRDCKYYKWEIDMCNREGATVFPMNVVHEEDYCSRAERKEE